MVDLLEIPEPDKLGLAPAGYERLICRAEYVEYLLEDVFELVQYVLAMELLLLLELSHQVRPLLVNVDE